MAAVAGAACGGTGAGQATADSSRAMPGGQSGARNDTAGPVGTARSRRATVVFLGTSLTAGLGLEPEESFPALLQERIDSAGLPFNVVNAGLSGETSAGALRRTVVKKVEHRDAVARARAAGSGSDRG